MTIEVTRRQEQVLNAIIRLKKDHGINPSMRQIAEEAGMHLSYVHFAITALVKKGKLTKRSRQHRSLRLKGYGKTSEDFASRP